MSTGFPCAPWIITMARVFEANGATLYAVGGSVRNALLGLPASDVDVCGAARPADVNAFCAGTDVRAVDRAAHFGTTELHVADADGRHMAEYTTFRVDSYRGGHRPESVRFADTPEQDALRRDFSMNALYRPIASNGAGALIDPTGGVAHMRAGALHTVTADPDAVLKDDGLRILRAARFQAELGYRPTDALLCSARRHAPLLAEIAPERLREELVKTLTADLRYPHENVQNRCTNQVARSSSPNHDRTGDAAATIAADGSRKSPQTDDCAALRQLPSSVAAGLRTLRDVNAWRYLFGAIACDDAAIDALERYVAPDGLAPVAGKLALLTRRAAPDALAEVMRRLRFPVRETDAAARLLTVTRALDDGALTRFAAVQAGRAAMAHAVAMYAALGDDSRSSVADELLQRLSRYPSSLRALAVGGDDLLPLCQALNAPSKRIGGVLNALWQAIAEDKLPNDRAVLLERAKELLRQA